jgi:DNA mismatch endonuclease, patch repair protein
MARVRAKDTSPERAVRSELHRQGYRYRLHRRDLPGTPDLVLSRYKTVVFVHGCFWHSHGCSKGKRPRTNTEFWTEKLDANRRRDRRQRAELEALGWRSHIVWECSLSEGVSDLVKRLSAERLVTHT